MPAPGRDSPTRLARLGRLTNDPRNADARVFVGNIVEGCEQELRDFFARYGDIMGMSMHNNGKYAFVQFDTEEQAQSAIAHGNGDFVAGRRIDVRPAVDKKKSGAGGSGGGGAAAAPRPQYQERGRAPPPRDSYSRAPPSEASYSSSSHSGVVSGAGKTARLNPSDFRLFDVGGQTSRSGPGGSQSGGAHPAPSGTDPGSASAPASSRAPPPDYSGTPGARYAPPPPSAASGGDAQRSAPPTAAQNEAPIPLRGEVPRPGPVGEEHHGRSRSPHWPRHERPVSPERHHGRSHSPGWYRYEDERRRYEYELARWEDEERYRRWYYERYGDPQRHHYDRERGGHYEDYRRERDYFRGREHERGGGVGGGGNRYDDYWRRQPEHRVDNREGRRDYERYPPPPAGDRERYPRPPEHRAPSPPADRHNELFDTDHRPSAAPAPAPAQQQRPPLDSLVLMVHKQQQGYANMISHRLKGSGMLSETREMPASAALPDIIAAGIKRKLLFLFVVTSENELHRSLSVHILHTSPVQEHKNMPFDDALGLVKTNFDEYCADVRAGRIPSRLAPVPPTSGAAPVSSTAANGSATGAKGNTPDISSEQLTSLISSLREKQQSQGTPAVSEGQDAGLEAKPGQATEGDEPKFNWTA